MIKTDIVEDGGMSYAFIFWIVENCVIWFDTQREADKRRKEIEYKMSVGQFKGPTCATVKEVLEIPS